MLKKQISRRKHYVLTNKLVVSNATTNLSLDKFIKSQKNLSKPSPKLWPDDPLPPESTSLDYQGLPTLTLDHPILQKLESCTKTTHFNQILTQITVYGLSQYSLAASRVIKKLCSSSMNSLSTAVLFFDSVEEPDAFLCNTILRCYVNLNDSIGGLRFYHEKMVAGCVLHNHFTFPLLGKIFADIGLVREGEKAHGRIIKLGFESDLFVRNSLIHMYSVCGRILSARKVFDGGSMWDLVSWNSMLSGFVKNGEVGIARELFDNMPVRDIFSWTSMITGYVGVGDMETARVLFEKMRVRDTVSWNCMIDGYSKTGDILSARELFDRMPSRNVVSWNIILALYVRFKHYHESLRLFEVMIEGGAAKPNEASLVSVLTSCANLMRLDIGKMIHSYVRNNRIKPDTLLSTALLTMYAKCGDMDSARHVFDQMPEKSVASWNNMITGYGMEGNGEKAIDLFLDMETSGLLPNEATFVCVLSACTHSGMVLEGWWFFDLMHRAYHMEPKVEHYGCMVDLLGRAGLVKDTENLIKEMPMGAGPALWGAILSSCRTQTNSELGRIVAKRVLELEPNDVGGYVMLSNAYAIEGKWDEVENVRRIMKEKGLEKRVASSCLVQVGNLSSTRKIMYSSLLSKIGFELKLSCR